MSNKRKTIKEFTQDAIAVHGDKYDYSLVDYKNNSTKVKMICGKHGIFEQTPVNHLIGKYGCNQCGIDRTKMTTNQFIQKAKSVHGNRYDYSLVEYIHSQTKIKIICNEHGIFKQRPITHLENHGCPICSYHISKPERQWLKHIELPDNNEHRQVSLSMNNGARCMVDGYDPTTNTIYEFYGDYWHGNPDTFLPNNKNTNNKKTFGQLYKDTMIKESLIKKSGYSLVVMWENDWNKKSPY